MRVNIYAEEMTDRLEIITKEIDGHKFTALRFYLELPVTLPLERTIQDGCMGLEEGVRPTRNVSGPFIHRRGDDDSAAVTFWGKRDLRVLLRKALKKLDEHYDDVCPKCKGSGEYSPNTPNHLYCTACNDPVIGGKGMGKKRKQMV